MKDKIEILGNDTKSMIKDYLNDQEIDKNSNTMIYEIKKLINRNEPSNNEAVNELKKRIQDIEDSMIEYSTETGTAYSPGKSLSKELFKFLFVDIFCNVASTAYSSKDIIRMMGTMTSVVDMTKASSSSGTITAIIYLITIIIVIICGLFNMF
jgi:hypothetical protein